MMQDSYSDFLDNLFSWDNNYLAFDGLFDSGLDHMPILPVSPTLTNVNHMTAGSVFSPKPLGSSNLDFNDSLFHPFGEAPLSLNDAAFLDFKQEPGLPPFTFKSPFEPPQSPFKEPGSVPSTSKSALRTPQTINPEKLCDKAEDALKRVRPYRPEVSVIKAGYPSSSFSVPKIGNLSHSLKRTYTEHNVPIKTEIVESISSFARASRAIAPLPNKLKMESMVRSLTYPQQTYYETSPASSTASSRCTDSDHGCNSYHDDDFTSTSMRPKKKQRRVVQFCQERKGKKTQLQIVLEDLPYSMKDILVVNGLYHCPFADCPQTTTSEGDLGRHLESSIHATHRYVCLAPRCLGIFAREDSMKRHHANNRGRCHRVEHDRFVGRGFTFRVKIEDVPLLKEKVTESAMREGCL